VSVHEGDDDPASCHYRGEGIVEAGSESQGSEPEFVDPFDSERDGESDGGEVEAVEPPALPPLMRASDLLPPEEEDDGAEVPPTPEEADLQSLPLAQREARKLAAMSPEQRERYDKATAELMAMPVVKAFSDEEDRARAAKKNMQEAFLAAYRKKQKESK
jgi:hypothetical protein